MEIAQSLYYSPGETLELKEPETSNDINSILNKIYAITKSVIKDPDATTKKKLKCTTINSAFIAASYLEYVIEDNDTFEKELKERIISLYPDVDQKAIPRALKKYIDYEALRNYVERNRKLIAQNSLDRSRVEGYEPELFSVYAGGYKWGQAITRKIISTRNDMIAELLIPEKAKLIKDKNVWVDTLINRVWEPIKDLIKPSIVTKEFVALRYTEWINGKKAKRVVEDDDDEEEEEEEEEDEDDEDDRRNKKKMSISALRKEFRKNKAEDIKRVRGGGYGRTEEPTLTEKELEDEKKNYKKNRENHTKNK